MSQIEFEDQVYKRPLALTKKDSTGVNSFMINVLIRLGLAKTTKNATTELIIFSIILLCIATYFFTHSSPSQLSNNIKYLSADGQTIIKQ
jgi:multisubunit Na+/H+ antiporter MnhG subunit